MLGQVFIKFLRGEGVTRLPWCAESVSDETNMLKKQLVRLNQRGQSVVPGSSFTRKRERTAAVVGDIGALTLDGLDALKSNYRCK